MAPSTRTQNAIIAGLAALAVGGSAFAVWSVGRPHPSLDGAESVTGSVRPANDASATTIMPEGGDATVEPEEPAESETTSAPSIEDAAEPSVDSWVAAWSGEADLLVIGDGFSNLPTQWVQLWARNLSADRPVQIHHWGEAADVAFNDPIVLSDSGDAPLTVWSASRAGSTIQVAAEHYDRFVEVSAQPSAVLVTMGLSSANEDIAAGLDALLEEIADDVPVLISIGPEDLYAEGVGDAILAWAQDNSDRVAVVDLRLSAPATPTAEQWARAFQRALAEA